MTLPWLEETVHVAPEGKEEGEEKQRKRTDEEETERQPCTEAGLAWISLLKSRPSILPTSDREHFNLL